MGARPGAVGDGAPGRAVPGGAGGEALVGDGGGDTRGTGRGAAGGEVGVDGPRAIGVVGGDVGVVVGADGVEPPPGGGEG